MPLDLSPNTEADKDFQMLNKFRHLVETDTKLKELKESAKSMRDKIGSEIICLAREKIEQGELGLPER